MSKTHKGFKDPHELLASPKYMYIGPMPNYSPGMTAISSIYQIYKIKLSVFKVWNHSMSYFSTKTHMYISHKNMIKWM